MSLHHCLILLPSILYLEHTLATIIASMSSLPTSSPPPRSFRDCPRSRALTTIGVDMREYTVAGSPKKEKPCRQDNGTLKLHSNVNGTSKPISNDNDGTRNNLSSSHSSGNPHRISASPGRFINQATIKNDASLCHPLTHLHSPE